MHTSNGLCAPCPMSTCCSPLSLARPLSAPADWADGVVFSFPYSCFRCVYFSEEEVSKGATHTHVYKTALILIVMKSSRSQVEKTLAVLIHGSDQSRLIHP